MRDRLPAPGKENRVKITLDDGRTVEGVLSYADDAAQAGSAYTKGNVLPDEVCDTLGIDRVQSEPKDAFLAIGNVATAPSGYATDFWKYLNFEHPILNAHFTKPQSFEIGSYYGNGEDGKRIETKTPPQAVAVFNTALNVCVLSTRESNAEYSDGSARLIVHENGFSVYGANLISGTFNYIAFT